MTRGIRNEALHAEIDRVTDLKLQIPTCSLIAKKHQVALSTVRQLISITLKRKRAASTSNKSS